MAENSSRVLRDAISKVKERLAKFKGKQLPEEATKGAFIEPILQALGWDIHDPDEVMKEYRRVPSDDPVDYALLLMKKPRLLLEAKALHVSLDDRKWLAKTVSYSAMAGVIWCVLSNGQEFRFYKATDPAPAEEKMFWKLSLVEDEPEEIAQFLMLVSRDGIERNLLEQFWRQNSLDRAVKASLEGLISKPDPGVVKLVRRQVTGRTPKDITDSIRRLLTVITIPNPPTKTKIDIDVDRVPELLAIIRAGILSAPLPLRARHKKVEIEATLQADGQILLDEKLFPSCSAAGNAAKKKVDRKDHTTSGWTFWSYRDAQGKDRRLKYAREQFRQTRGSGSKLGSG